MRWKLLTFPVVALVLTACTSAPDNDPEPTPVSTDRGAVIAELRSIDTCALYPSDGVADRPITLSGFGSPLSCVALVEDPAGDITTTIAVNVAPSAPVNEEAWVRHRTIDGVDVSVASALDPDAPPLGDVVSWTCTFHANYPDEARLMVIVASPPDADGCAVGEDLLRTAMRAYDSRPQWGSGPVPPTVLSGKDACAPVERLRATHDIEVLADESTVSTCMFTIDGSPLIEVALAYQDPAMLDVNPDQRTISGHRVAGDPASGMYDVVVGESFPGARGAAVPVVSVADFALDMGRIQRVLEAIAEEY